ncbi:glycosyltransferase [Flavobacterium sp. CYK-4]|uniref:glycosyltransferase family 2 protein n=1 Tax=Flavobacterium lotistagni TaxID=2709660 RepID=UPI00140DE368|nr:glycosyltransferase [Flavobacterium lotistagni]NHM06717.1 glycosyltransferase [Flavobacterium lotistagni]
MILVFFLIMLVYVLTMAQLIIGFGKITSTPFKAVQPRTFFALVVPFRNESRNLPLLLESIKNLNYPKDLFEIILVDDASGDDSVKQIYNWRMENGVFQTTLLENIRLSDSPKKDAISRAVPIVQHDWIVTTDADCLLPENWLLALDQHIQSHEVELIVGAVKYDAKHTLLHHFQQLDLMSLQGTTIGSFGMGLGFLCNGANLCYTKNLFTKLHGFVGNNQIASGDDVFLLQKAMRECPDKVSFLKSTEIIVRTKPESSWAALFSQRVRWASKTGNYYSVFGKDLAVIVFLANFSLIVCCGLTILGSRLLAPEMLVALFGLKFFTDAILLYKTNRFLQTKSLWWLLPASVIYPFFCVSVAVFSWFGNYTWKGRKFKR